MKVLNNERRYGAHNERGSAEGIDLNSSFHFVGGLWVESFKAKSAELSGLAAAGSWGFSGANLHLVTEFVSLEFAGMNCSGVVTAGSNRSPGTNSLSWSNNGQRVANVDVDYLMPTDCNRSEWVGDNHAFIEDFDLWSNENQVCSEHECCGPKASGNSGLNILGQPQSRGQQRAQREHQAGKNVATARSEDLSITHVSIIAGDK